MAMCTGRISGGGALGEVSSRKEGGAVGGGIILSDRGVRSGRPSTSSRWLQVAWKSEWEHLVCYMVTQHPVQRSSCVF